MNGAGLALGDLGEVITPRLADEQAGAKAKSLARQIKWWRARERYGALFEQTELAEIGGALGGTFTDLLDARRAFARAVLEKQLPEHKSLQLCFNRVCRETALMRDAMGSIADCYFSPLDPE